MFFTSFMEATLLLKVRFVSVEGIEEQRPICDAPRQHLSGIKTLTTGFRPGLALNQILPTYPKLTKVTKRSTAEVVY